MSKFEIFERKHRENLKIISNYVEKFKNRDRETLLAVNALSTNSFHEIGFWEASGRGARKNAPAALAMATGFGVKGTIYFCTVDALHTGLAWTMAPLSAAGQPWFAAFQIAHKFWPDEGMALNDLHDLYPDGNEPECNNTCHVVPNRDLGWGMGESSKKMKACEDSCYYFAEALDLNLVKTCAQTFLGVITLGATTVLGALGDKAIDLYRSGAFAFSKHNKENYITPSDRAYWHQDEDCCAFPECNTMLGTSFKFWQPANHRHHCRLCGWVFCGDHCKHKVPILFPLRSEDTKLYNKGVNYIPTPTKNLEEDIKVNKGFNRNREIFRDHCPDLVEVKHELICQTCLSIAKALKDKDLHGLMSERLIRAKTLIDCARNNNCPRAQAALLVAFQNNPQHAIKAMLVHDGATVLADQIL